MGPGSSKKAESTLTNQQIAAQGGGSGSATIAVGANAETGTANKSNITNVGGGTISIVSADPSVAIAAIEGNQALATQAVSYANNNATQALSVLQELGHEIAQVATGNSPNQIGMTTVSTPADIPPDNTRLYLIAGVIAIALVLVITMKRKN